MKTVELVFFDAGGGHRSAANALCEVVRRAGTPLGDADDESPGTARRDGCFPQAHRRAPAGPLQSDAAARLDARFAGADEGHARRHPGAAFEAGETALELLAEQTAGHGRFGDSEFQSRDLSGHPAGDAERSAGHDPDRHGGLSAAFLDRAAAAVLDLRNGARVRAGAAARAFAGSRVPHVGHDSESAVLRACRRSIADRTARRSGSIPTCPPR